MPKACAVKYTAKAVHRYGWTMLSVLGPKAISFTVNTSVGETITVTITKMQQYSVILAEPVQQQIFFRKLNPLFLYRYSINNYLRQRNVLWQSPINYIKQNKQYDACISATKLNKLWVWQLFFNCSLIFFNPVDRNTCKTCGRTDAVGGESWGVLQWCLGNHLWRLLGRQGYNCRLQFSGLFSVS